MGQSGDGAGDPEPLPILTFADLGTTEGFRLSGLQARREFFIPATKEMRPTQLTLHLSPSPQWPGGALQVFAQNRLLRQVALQGSSQVVNVSLARAPRPSDGALRLEFETGLDHTEPCLAAQLFHLNVAPRSRITYRYEAPDSLEIHDFFPPFLRQITLYLPDPVPPQAAQMALWLSGFATRKYTRKPPRLRIRRRPDSISQIPVPNVWERAVVWAPDHDARVLWRSSREGGAKDGGRLDRERRYTVRPGDIGLMQLARRFYDDASKWLTIFKANRDRLPSSGAIRPGQTLRIPRLDEHPSSQRRHRGPLLLLGGLEEARQLFLDEQGLETAATPALTSETIKLKSPDELGPRVSLGQLGYGTRQLEGTGQISTTYNIQLADLGKRVYPVGFRFRIPHTPVPSGGRATLQVSAGQNQLTSALLEGTQVDQFASIPQRFLTRELNLNVRVNYVAPEGNCTRSPLPLSGEVDPRSSLVLKRGWAFPPGFDRFPQAFVRGFNVYLDSLSWTNVQHASRLVKALQRTTSRVLAPHLRESIPEDGALLAVGRRRLERKLRAPVRFRGFRIVDQDGRTQLAFRPEAPQALLQGFEREGQNRLLLSYSPKGDVLADSLLSGLLRPDGWFGIHGDLAIRGRQGPVHVLQVQTQGVRIEPLPPSIGSIFKRYRVWFYVGAAVLILGLLLFIYPNVVRDEPSVE